MTTPGCKSDSRHSYHSAVCADICLLSNEIISNVSVLLLAPVVSSCHVSFQCKLHSSHKTSNALAKTPAEIFFLYFLFYTVLFASETIYSNHAHVDIRARLPDITA